jgi:diguanylate cyclase (GGDEF)-like protein/PAS domain S-box-containing protein
MTFNEDFYKELLDNLNDGLYFVDPDRLVIFWNKAAQQLTGYHASEVIGRHCGDGLFAHLDQNGSAICTDDSCPALDAIRTEREVERDMFVHHKAGHQIPVRARAVPIRNEQRRITGVAVIYTNRKDALTAAQRIRELERLAMNDALTSMANRRFMEITLRARLAALQRYGWSFGALFLDIDDFKKVNDSYGHEIGDQVLKMVAKTLQNSLRPFDIVGRWGGEEFLGIVLNADEDQLYRVANRCRVLIEKSGFKVRDDEVRVTASIGTTIAHARDTVDSLVKRVDNLLYQSKAAGKNRITVRVDTQ